MEWCQQERRLFNKGDVGAVGVELRKCDGQVVVAEFGQRAGCFDPGGAAADHEDPQVTILSVDHGLFQLGEYLVPQRKGLRPAYRAASSTPRAPGMSKKLAVTPAEMIR